MQICVKLKNQKEEILRIATLHGARNVKVFGSAIHDGPEEAHDLDLLVEMEKGRTLLDLIAIKQNIEDLLHCKVDVVTTAALSPYIRDEVLSKAVEL